ncbi:MAG: ATP-binding protein [Lachnospira sp.]
MRLISCNIENFGKLSDVRIDFNTDGITTFYESNGWGKSTLAAFIKVMLYGFDNENKRSAQEKERLKYKPWQGGVYGGELRFETDKGEYIVSRTFGTKEKDDVFELTDAATMLPTKEYSEKLGEEIFGLDSESFKKSIFVSQNQCNTTTTDSINARLGNITDNEADINDYEKLSKKLTDLLNSMSPKRSTGSINIAKNEVEEIKQELKNGAALDSAMDECSELLKQQRKDVVALNSEREKLYRKRKEYSQYKDIEVKKKEYEALVEEEKRLGKKLKEKESVFHGYVPSGEELEEYISKSNKLADAGKLMESFCLTPDEEIELEQLKQLHDAGEFSEERLEAIVSGNTADDKDINDKDNLKENTLGNEAADSGNSKKDTALPLPVMIVIILGAIMCVGGGVFAIVNISAGLCVSSVGIILAVYGISAVINQRKRLELEAAQKREEQLKAERIRADVMKAELEAKWAKKALMENKRNAYNSLKSKQDKYLNARNEYSNLNQAIEEFFDRMYIRMDKDPRVQLVNLSNEHREYMRILRDLGTKKSELERFSKENDVDMLMTLKPVKEDNGSLSELEETISQLDYRLKQAEKNVGEYENQLYALQERKDGLNALENRYNDMVSQLEKDERKYRLLNGVKDHMEAAKDALISKYTEPVKKSFDKYKNILLGKAERTDDGDKPANDEYYLDAKMNLTVKQMGMRRESWTQSAGYQDLTGICMRMAFIDVMYEKEKPFVIFDDPFVNLDDDKLDNGIQMLKEISKEHQIIYFTCHKSRTV